MNGILKRTLSVWLMALAALAFAAPARAESLADALISAYRNSGLLEQNRALLRAADEDVAASMAALRPILSYFASATYSEPVRVPGGDRLSANIGLSAEMLLYDGGSSKLATEAAKETVLATRQGLIDVEQQVLLRAVTAYMNVRRDREIVALRENNVRVIREQLRAAQDRFNVGEVTRTDVAIARSRLAQAEAGLASAKGALAASREEYRAAIGHYPKSLKVPPRLPQTAKSREAAQSVALASHPQIRKVQHEVAAAELSVRRAAMLMRPQLKLSGQVAIDDNGNDSSSIGLEFGGPIYQGGKLSALYRKAMAQRDAARAALHTVGLNIAQGVGNAWANLQVARAQITATDQQIRAARVAFRGTEEEAKLGARTTLDVLDAEQELLDAQASRVSAVTSEYIAAYSLLSSMGLLTVEHLRLGIPTYDPAAYYNTVQGGPATGARGKRLDAVMKALGK